MGSFSALLTAFYSVRLIYLTFLTNTNANVGVFRGVQESSLNIIFPLLLLGLGSILVGYLVKEAIIPHVITPVVSNFIKIIPFVLSLLGMFMAFFMCSFSSEDGTRLFYFSSSAY